MNNDTFTCLLDSLQRHYREATLEIEGLKTIRDGQAAEIKQAQARIAELEGLIEAYEASVNYPRPEDVDRIAELESDLAGCIKLIAKYESERDDT